MKSSIFWAFGQERRKKKAAHFPGCCNQKGLLGKDTPPPHSPTATFFNSLVLCSNFPSVRTWFSLQTVENKQRKNKKKPSSCDSSGVSCPRKLHLPSQTSRKMTISMAASNGDKWRDLIARVGFCVTNLKKLIINK